MIRLIKIRPYFHITTIRFIIWTLLLVSVTFSYGQTTSTRGNFEVDNIIGCAPLTVTPNTLFTGSVGTTQYFYENTLDPLACTENYQTHPGECVNTTNTSNGQFTYNTPGTYYLIQILGTTPLPEVDFIEITVLEPAVPTFATALCNNNRVVLTFDFGQDNYNFYEIDFGDGAPVTILDKTGSSEISYTYGTQGSYSIQVSGKLNTGSDINCGISPAQMISTIESIPTPQIRGLTVLDEQTVEISYETLTENIRYELLLKVATNPFSNVASIDPVANPNTFTYNLSTPIANIEDLRFQLGAVEACGVVQNFSNIIRNVRTSYAADYLNVNELTITSNWSTDHTTAEITDVSFVFDGIPEAVNTAPLGEYRKVLANCTDVRPYYYEVALNGAVSRSITFLPDFSINGLSPPRATGLRGRLAGAAVILTYDEAPVPTGEYRIYRSTPTARILAGTTSGTTFTVEDFELTDSEVCFVVTYVDDCGFESIPTEEVCFEFSPILRLPNAFSPNGDGHNDTFGVPVGVYPDFQMLIFDRWGRMVYSSNNPTQHWDGFISGQAAPSGSYVYRINYNFTPNSPVSLTGSITLIR